ncbi:CoB--CoM heterodisulfide reductase iron-sulfur subunit B family protein [Calderihabitans maritimus]|uniref:CoB--CoM heterodisulfide reductase n=1 Tax=Calderihabitans maritimus TaxID=1246530 RepID=A0A1Z5HP96_9FIRM|nr:CoB--CoM heterodisulfide reductase iron-sulfur subunit B family protein [Calderihabitans maritimus]GAW91110.1 CoB--CoM heterodisulfide reductase [Calderihabitans maritimus]
MKYAYYPGCSLHASAKDYDLSLKATCKKLSIDLIEVDDWNCCGATAAPSVDPVLAIALAARNLARAESKETDVAVACNACYSALKRTAEKLNKYSQINEQVQTMLQEVGLNFSGKIKVKHLLEVLASLDAEEWEKHIVKPLTGLKVACYYGCQIVRPRTFDDPEQPRTLDMLMQRLGAEAVPFYHKTKCCGGALSTTKEKVALKMVKEILLEAASQQADLIVTVCPLCQLNLDAYQDKVNETFGTNLEIPVIYFTQLTGLALGANSRQLGLDKPIVSPAKALANFL